MKTDYYELLGVETSASSSELKRAFRKKALKLHPDKNPSPDAADIFNEVRVAYETLMDPQDRSWYDSHKYQILAEDDDLGDQKSMATDEDDQPYYTGTTIDDVMKYFNDDLYCKMDDSFQGFYKVVSVLVTKIASEEVTSGKKQNLPNFDTFQDDLPSTDSYNSDNLMFPKFGNSQSDYGTQVRLFYRTWSNFQSVKTFSWVDEYRYSMAPDRRTRRQMERENKKKRQRCRKEYNETIRKWISFIKKKDPRVNTKVQRDYEREKVRKQQEELKRQAQRERKQRLHEDSEYVQQSWEKIDADELADIEKQLDEIYDDEKKLNGENKDANEEDRPKDLFECIVCNKTFKSEQQLKGHEKSKKHKKKLKKLKWEMRKEGLELGIDHAQFIEKEETEDEFDDAVESISDLSDANIEVSVIPEKPKAIPSDTKIQETPVNIESMETKRDNPVTVPKKSEKSDTPVETEVIVDNDLDSESELSFGDSYGNKSSSSRRGRTIEDTQLTELTAILNGTSLNDNDDDDWSTNKRSKKGKKKRRVKKDKAKPKTKSSASQPASNQLKCVVCGATFNSRNKLFHHVRKAGHTALRNEVYGTK